MKKMINNSDVGKKSDIMEVLDKLLNWSVLLKTIFLT